LSPVELKENIVLVNYIEEDLSNSAGEVPPSKEGLKMKILYVTPDVRLEHEFEKYSTDEPVERSPSIARIPTRLQILYTSN
jgi:hypothetical protein